MTKAEAKIQHALGTLQWYTYVNNDVVHVFLRGRLTICGRKIYPVNCYTSDYGEWWFAHNKQHIKLVDAGDRDRCKHCLKQLENGK